MTKINTLSLDLETFSDVDLNSCGVYKYASSPNFEILLFGYSVNGGEVNVIDLAQGEKIPMEIMKALTDESVTKWAFNAQFERVCLSEYLRKNYPQYFCSYSIPGDTVGDYMSPVAWKCSMVWSAYMGLPLSLKGVGSVIGLEEQKLTEGKDLIRYFCIPCKGTKTNNGRVRNLPCHAPDKWESFKEYNKRDVEVEMAIQHRLAKFLVPDFIWDQFWLDQEINDRGIELDMKMVKNAIEIDEWSKAELTEKIQKVTGVDKPSSVVQMKNWLAYKGMKTDSLDKKAVADLLKTASPALGEVLELRQQLAKSSVKKYTAMLNTACDDNRARGMFRFYGANRTGRWSGKHIQLQNLPQNHMSDLAQARGLILSENHEMLSLLYDSVPDALSELIRTAFIAQEGKKFIVSDFSAIEARVIAWIAGEKWRMKVFADGGDIYCASASQMFKVPVVKNGENGHLRQKGKIAELALGYGGSVGALRSMGALDMELTEEELQPLVTAWRNSNPNITKLWWDVDRAAKECVRMKTSAETHGIQFTYESGFLFITLPSGRRLAYVKPRMGVNQFGGEAVTYEGIGGTKKWERLESYGPKFVENIVQGIARDILAYAMQTLRHCAIVGHVHDELIIECGKEVSLEAVCEQMGRTPSWAKGLLLRADGYECDFYKKE